MGFIDSYKRLEKLCGEIMQDERKISAYIEEMQSKPNGSSKVPGWDTDLKNLKHYRWIRNKIAHEPDCTEKNMCVSGDIRWLDEFYSRIINQKDPLTLYRKASNRCVKATKSTCTKPQPTRTKTLKKRKKSKKNYRFLIVALIILITAIVGFFIVKHFDLFDGDVIETIYKKFQQIIG